jgi:hypothetical protein
MSNPSLQKAVGDDTPKGTDQAPSALSAGVRPRVTAGVGPRIPTTLAGVSPTSLSAAPALVSCRLRVPSTRSLASTMSYFPFPWNSFSQGPSARVAHDVVAATAPPDASSIVADGSLRGGRLCGFTIGDGKGNIKETLDCVLSSNFRPEETRYLC